MRLPNIHPHIPEKHKEMCAVAGAPLLCRGKGLTWGVLLRQVGVCFAHTKGENIMWHESILFFFGFVTLINDLRTVFITLTFVQISGYAFYYY